MSMDNFDRVIADEVEKIKAQQKLIPTLERNLQDAQRAGIDTTELQKELLETKQRISKFLAVYGKL